MFGVYALVRGFQHIQMMLTIALSISESDKYFLIKIVSEEYFDKEGAMMRNMHLLLPLPFKWENIDNEITNAYR